MSAFHWTVFDEGSMECEWMGVFLYAGERGFWAANTADDREINADMQVDGSTLQDAQQRAQAAAMILHELSTRTK